MATAITPGKEADSALSQAALYQAGMEHVRRLAGRIWTDHNTHDPGVTTLELLTYALSDLSYRTTLPIQDLVTSASDNPANLARQFRTAREILPIDPFTLSDFRKLVIDQKGVQNAWVIPDELTFYADTVEARVLCSDPLLPGIRKVDVRGLFRVLLEYSGEIRTTAQQQEVKTSVRATLDAHRNLCQEFTSIDGVSRQEFIVCAELDLIPTADTALVKAEIFAAIQNYLAPPVMSYSLSQMLDKRTEDGRPKYPVSEIFEGPRLKHGFIDTEELAAAKLRTEVRLSDVIGLVMDIQGVIAVRNLVINPPGADELASRWVQPVENGKQPVLNASGSRLAFYKGIMPVVPDPAKVAAHSESIAGALKDRLEGPGLENEDLPIPSGRFRDPGRYQSFQNHFPAIYGVGPYGVAPDDPRALALSRQLKAYLLFFDQVMANYCVQLAAVRRLLSWESGVEHCRFSQLVDTLSDYRQIYAASDPAGKLINLMETSQERAAGRNGLLDHMIGRFAERFHDYAEVMRSAFGAGFDSLEQTKCAFLSDYPNTSATRATAENYHLGDGVSGWNSDNVSGLERRIAGLLGIPRATRRNLGDISLGTDAEVYENPPGKFSFRLHRGPGGSILLYTNTKYGSAGEAADALSRAVTIAQDSAAYDLKVAEGGKYYFNVVDGAEIVALGPGRFDTHSLREQAIEDLIGYLRLNYGREGMYLIENLLLRPMSPCSDDLLLPICIDPACTDCADDDPYSYRIQIVLPAEAGRFRNMNFRSFAEQVIRQETPAHILPKVCWISDEDMLLLQGDYRRWIEVRSHPEDSRYARRLNDLKEILYRVKNIYPQSRLGDCGSEEESMFILGENALGTLAADN